MKFSGGGRGAKKWVGRGEEGGGVKISSSFFMVECMKQEFHISHRIRSNLSLTPYHAVNGKNTICVYIIQLILMKDTAQKKKLYVTISC